MSKQKPELHKRNSPISLFLASTSKIKIDAVKGLINEKKILASINSITGSSSEVNEQPVGEDEILKGAINRALSAKKIDPRGEVYIAIENGIEWNICSEEWLDYAIVLAFIPTYGCITYVKSQAVAFPLEQVNKTYSKEGSFCSNTVGKTLQEDGIVQFHDDPHLNLVGVSRKEILKNALIELVEYFLKEYF